MGKIVGFVSKSERERIRLVREARAIYDSIFPPNDALGERQVSDPGRLTKPDGIASLHRKDTSGA